MTTNPDDPTQGDGLTIREAAHLVADWIEPARQIFSDGFPVHLTMSPGDWTAYVMTFVPAPTFGFATSGEMCRIGPRQAFLGVGNTGTAIGVNPDGSPYPSYVEEKLGTSNPHTILAVGLCWWLMVGDGSTQRTEQAAAVFGTWLEGIGAGHVLPKWERQAFEGRAFDLAGAPPSLTIVELTGEPD